MTADKFRAMALRIPGAVEQAHMNHPDFRIEGKVFASLGSPGDGWGMVKLTPEEQGDFTEQAPAMFTPCNGAWGRQGCTYVRLASADRRLLKTALAAAARNVAAKANKKRQPMDATGGGKSLRPKNRPEKRR